MKSLLLMSLFLLLQFIGGDKEQEKLSQSLLSGLESYYEESDQSRQFMQLCSSANLRVFVNPNYYLRTVTVSFELLESKHKNCFSYFYIFLEHNGHVYSAKVPYHGELNQAISHRFENVSCGAYNLSIKPCINSWQFGCMVINYPNKINMIKCFRSSLASNLNLKDHEDTVSGQMLTVILICLLVLLAVAGVVCFRLVIKMKSLPSYLPTNLKEYEPESGLIECSEVKLKKEVFFINYHDRNTLEKVASLKESILANCAGAYISGIGNMDDFNDFLTDSCSWLDKKLQAPTQEDVVRKIILVDSIGKMEEEIHENENETFMDAIEKLYRNFAGRRFDYKNVFVVHFGHSRTKIDKLSHIVEDRYLIPDHLQYLYQSIMIC